MGQKPIEGSNPSLSAISQVCPDLSVPPYTLENQTLAGYSETDSLVSVGLNGSPKRHKFATNDTNLPRTPLLFSRPAFERCQKIAQQENYHGALTRLKQVEGFLWLGDLDLSINDHELSRFAEKLATKVRDHIQFWQNHPEMIWGHIKGIAKSYDITLPDHQKEEAETLLKLSRSHWWLCQLRSVRRRLLDNVQRDLGFVQSNKFGYSGSHAMILYKEQVARNKKYMEETTIINECGDEISLKEIAEHSLANPAVRRAELMTRIRGFEEVAKYLGDCGMFYTLTTPSRFHSQLHNGAKNPKHTGHTVKDGQAWLQMIWSQVRAKLHRDKIQYYGFRVAEPHHDGTPHWHLLLFVNPKQKHRLTKIFRKYALREMERGAEQHRLKVEEIDPEKGSAIGYIAKYISKNIDGEFLDQDLYGNDAKESALRINCWARTHGIRQFQQIGGPNVSVWRELRRLREPITNCPELEEVRLAADAGAWAAYVLAMGGIAMRRADRPVKLLNEYRESVNEQTGEITVEDKTWYGGKKAVPIRGLECGNYKIITRIHVWSIAPKTELASSGGVCERQSPGADPPQEVSSRREAPLDSCK
jgi:hypothetical protein